MNRYALTIGINTYPGTGADLAGCLNDALDWEAALIARGFDVRALHDSYATGGAIRASIADLIHTAKPGDTAVVTYSGHGTWVPDQNGDEPDRRDEAICPTDLMAHGPIIDDELSDLFMARERGVELVFVSDSCHSGTVSRFADTFGTENRGHVRFLPPETFMTAAALNRALTVSSPAATRTTTTALLLAGCRDTEYSYDASFNGRPNGAFSRAALETLKTRPATYQEWMTRIRTVLPSRDYPQTPQLFGTATQKRWTLP